MTESSLAESALYTAVTLEISDSASLAKTPMVSVIMLAYRHEKYIAQAIEGVVAQTCDFPIELIIGEDCSSDRTLEIVLRYQHQYPRVIRVLTAKRNVGMHANGDRCFKACRGEFVASCEGDDYWHDPQKLQMQADAIRTADDITLCHTDYDRLIGTRLKRNRHRAAHSPYLAQGCAFESLLQRWTVMTATTMYRASIVRAFGASSFCNTAWPFGDYNLALFAAANGRVVYLPTSTAVWRKVAGSATNVDPAQILRMRLASLECREAFMAKYSVADVARKECLCFANRNVMNAALHACDPVAFGNARDRLIQMGCTLPRLDDWLRRTALGLRFPAKAYQAVRSALLRISTDKL